MAVRQIAIGDFKDTLNIIFSEMMFSWLQVEKVLESKYAL